MDGWIFEYFYVDYLLEIFEFEIVIMVKKL